MKGRLRYYTKNKIRDHYVMELSIYEIEKSSKYPDGIKYGLICKDLRTDAFVLFDNHHPKGPHVHINERELSYDYIDDDKLVEDFKILVLKELGVKL